MNLGDEVQIEGPTGESPGEDSHGNELPPPVGILATVPAHVFYTQSGLEFNGSQMFAKEELRCIIEPLQFDLDADVHKIIWRGDYYRYDGALIRSKNGATHHLTLNLTRFP